MEGCKMIVLATLGVAILGCSQGVGLLEQAKNLREVPDGVCLMWPNSAMTGGSDQCCFEQGEANRCDPGLSCNDAAGDGCCLLYALDPWRPADALEFGGICCLYEDGRSIDQGWVDLSDYCQILIEASHAGSLPPYPFPDISDLFSPDAQPGDCLLELDEATYEAYIEWDPILQAHGERCCFRLGEKNWCDYSRWVCDPADRGEEELDPDREENCCSVTTTEATTLGRVCCGPNGPWAWEGEGGDARYRGCMMLLEGNH